MTKPNLRKLFNLQLKTAQEELSAKARKQFKAQLKEELESKLPTDTELVVSVIMQCREDAIKVFRRAKKLALDAENLAELDKQLESFRERGETKFGRLESQQLQGFHTSLRQGC